MADQHDVIVVDLGSSGLRAHAVPRECPWSVPPGAARTYAVRRRVGELWQAFSPKTLRVQVLDVVRQAIAGAGIYPERVAAVAVIAQRGGTAFLDSNGATLYVGPNRDLRAVFEGAEMDELYGDDIYAQTGHLPSMFFAPAKLRWWQRNRPRQAQRIATVLSLGAWAVHELTGVAVETAPSLSESGMFDLASKAHRPPRDLLESLGFDPSLLPPIVPTGAPAGTLTHAAAEATGLAPSTPVYLVGPDAQAAMLGMGVIRAGDTGVAAGWSGPVQRVTERPLFDKECRAWTGVHLAKGVWILEGNPGDTGGTLEAVRRLLRLSHERFHALAAHAPDTTTAIWGPRALDLSSPGMSLGGILLPTPVTHEGIDPGAIARATLTNIAYAIRECVELLDEVGGLGPAADVEESIIALTGGMSLSAPFPGLLASVLGRPVARHHANAAATGAAIAASRPPREWPKASKEASYQAQIIEPDPYAALEHASLYQRWRRLRTKLDELSGEM